MTKHHKTHATANGVTASQPGVGVSTRHQIGTDVWVLHVYREYQDLPNKFGGNGRSKPLDANGMVFPSSEAAREYAIQHGYLQLYRPDPLLRARRLAMAHSRPRRP